MTWWVTWWDDAMGRTASVSHRFTEDEVLGYARLTGDPGPFPDVPEPLVAGLFSRLLGVDLPGPGTSYLKQELRFLAPVPLDTEVTATVEVVRVRRDKRLVYLSTTCTTGGTTGGRPVCRGQALVLAGGVPAP